MSKREMKGDLSEYLPDEAALAEVAAGSPEYNEVDPELVAKLRRLGTNPDLLRIPPPSVTAYVAPTEIRAANPDDATLPRGGAKVEVALPLGPSEYPTLPALKRLRGEPDVPGVVKGATEPRADARQTSVRTAVLAVLAVLLPVLLVIVVMGRGPRREEHNGAAASASASAPAAGPSVQPSPTVSVSPTIALSAAPAPSVAPAAVPSTTASASVPAPTGALPKPKPRGVIEDPYDAAPPAPPPTATPSAKPAAPSDTAAPAQSPEPLPKFIR